MYAGTWLALENIPTPRSPRRPAGLTQSDSRRARDLHCTWIELERGLVRRGAITACAEGAKPCGGLFRNTGRAFPPQKSRRSSPSPCLSAAATHSPASALRPPPSSVPGIELSRNSSADARGPGQHTLSSARGERGSGYQGTRPRRDGLPLEGKGRRGLVMDRQWTRRTVSAARINECDPVTMASDLLAGSPVPSPRRAGCPPPESPRERQADDRSCCMYDARQPCSCTLLSSLLEGVRRKNKIDSVQRLGETPEKERNTLSVPFWRDVAPAKEKANAQQGNSALARSVRQR